MRNKNITNFGIDTNKYSWLSQNLWDEKQIQYFYTNQFIIPSGFRLAPFIKVPQSKKDKVFNKISINSWLLSKKSYLPFNKNDSPLDVTQNSDENKDIKALITIRSHSRIYNRLELFYKFFPEKIPSEDIKDIEDIFYLMISALFIVYKADTIEFISSSFQIISQLDQLCADTIKSLSLPKQVFKISDTLLKQETIHTLTHSTWKDFRKKDEEKLFYLNPVAELKSKKKK